MMSGYRLRSGDAQTRTNEGPTDYSITFHGGDAETLALPDDTVELVTARHLVWTLPNPPEALQEWQ